MSRISACFKQLKAENKVALIPFVTAGDPNPDVTVSLMHQMVEAGANLIELGVPFSDPMADGPVIQRASERALLHHVSLRDVLKMTAEFREKDAQTPVILMGYLNPFEIMGYEAFAQAASNAGVDGVLTVDIPPEEAVDFVRALDAKDIDLIFLIAPTTTTERMKKITDKASGFVYYVSVKGITGAANLDVDAVSGKVEHIRQVTDLPIGVGFGIKDAKTAKQVAQVADAVIVGSALVKQIEALAETPEKIAPALASTLSSMRLAMDKD